MPHPPAPPGVDLEGGPAWGRVFCPVSQPTFTTCVQKGAFSEPGQQLEQTFLNPSNCLQWNKPASVIR